MESGNGKFRETEPWTKMIGHGGEVDLGDGYQIQHRTLIKNSADAPHLAIVMPVGNKGGQIVGVDADGKKDIVASYRQPGLVPIELMLNQMQVMQPLNVSLSWFILKNDISSVLRERMTHEAIKLGVNFLFYWDDDVLIPPGTWYRMLNHMSRYPDIGIVSGVYFTKSTPSEPVIYKDAGTGSYWGFDTNPESPPEDIYSAGAGCMMARAEAVKKMEAPYWLDERTGNDTGTSQGIIGHDVRFCRNMRDQTGYRVTVDGSIQCQHLSIDGQKVFKIPDDRPPHPMAREMSDSHAGVGGAGSAVANTEDEIMEAVVELAS